MSPPRLGPAAPAFALAFHRVEPRSQFLYVDAFWQTPLGGALTVAGGFAGSFFIRWRDNIRDACRRRNELVAAIRVVRYELSSNVAAIASLGSTLCGMPLPIDIQHRSCREVQLILARELPSALREQLARAYETFIATTNLEAMRTRGGSADEVKAVQQIGEQMREAPECGVTRRLGFPPWR